MEFPQHLLHLPFEGAAPHERRQLGLVVVCGAMLISAIDMTIVNVALPDIAEDLNAAIVGTVLAGVYGRCIGPLRDQLLLRVDDAYDVAARAGFGVCVAVLLLSAGVAALALSPERLLTKIQTEP